MTLGLYQSPVKTVGDVSALSLHHVGHAAPTECCGLSGSAYVEVLMTLTSDRDTIELFRWSLGLRAKMLVRALQEGSAIVMKVISTNTAKPLRKAIGCAPRGERANWRLTIQDGTQSILPLAWSLERGALESAEAIVQVLLTFRADRDRYHHGMDASFKRRPETVQTWSTDALTVLPKMLDGRIWRSRTAGNTSSTCLLMSMANSPKRLPGLQKRMINL